MYSLPSRSTMREPRPRSMKIGYFPKFAGPREEELLASIRTPRVRSYACFDFSVMNKTNLRGGLTRPAMVQQLAHLAGGCGQSAESGLEIPRNFCQGEHSCQSGLLLTNPPQKNKGR